MFVFDKRFWNGYAAQGDGRCDETTHVTLALPKSSSIVEGSLKTSEGNEVPYHLRPFDPENPAYEGTVTSDDGSKFPFEIPLKSVPFPASPRGNLWTPVSDQQLPYVVTLPVEQDIVVVTNPMQLADSHSSCYFALIEKPPAQPCMTNMSLINQAGHHVVYMPLPNPALVSPAQELGTPTHAFPSIDGVQFYSEEPVESFVTPTRLHEGYMNSRLVCVDSPSEAGTQTPLSFFGGEQYVHPEVELVRQASILCTDINGLSTMYGVTNGSVFDDETPDPVDPQTPYLTQGVASLDWHPVPMFQLENGMACDGSNPGIPVFETPALDNVPWTYGEEANNYRVARAHRKRKLAEMRARQGNLIPHDLSSHISQYQYCYWH